METLARAPELTCRAERVLRDSGLLGNPYFEELRDGTMSLARFRRSQERFYFAVAFFPRVLATLAARLPEPRQRLALIRNLMEEHGDFQEEAFHQTTFQRFLETVGSREGFIGALPDPAVRAFNLTLHGACSLDDWETGAACLGFIEYAFCGISALIGQTVVQRGWVPAEGLVHYSLHAELDSRHAEDLFALVEPAWRDPARLPLVESGLRLGAYAFDSLYRELGAANEPRRS